jgi:lysophospholipase L1-like esterase
MVRRARAFGARQVLLATNHPTPRTERLPYAPVSYQRQNEAYNRIIRHVGRRVEATLVDHERAWRRRLGRKVRLESLLLPDGVHLSAAGHDLYFEVLYPFIEKAVRQLR